MLGWKFILTQSPVLCSSKQEYNGVTEESRKSWQSSAACIFTPWELQTALSFNIAEHVEVIFIVSLMCHFSRSTFFPVGVSVNGLSVKQPFIIIMKT